MFVISQGLEKDFKAITYRGDHSLRGRNMYPTASPASTSNKF